MLQLEYFTGTLLIRYSLKVCPCEVHASVPKIASNLLPLLSPKEAAQMTRRLDGGPRNVPLRADKSPRGQTAVESAPEEGQARLLWGMGEPKKACKGPNPLVEGPQTPHVPLQFSGRRTRVTGHGLDPPIQP